MVSIGFDRAPIGRLHAQISGRASTSDNLKEPAMLKIKVLFHIFLSHLRFKKVPQCSRFR